MDILKTRGPTELMRSGTVFALGGLCADLRVFHAFPT